jgi:hypothetical protein
MDKSQAGLWQQSTSKLPITLNLSVFTDSATPCSLLSKYCEPSPFSVKIKPPVDSPAVSGVWFYCVLEGRIDHVSYVFPRSM